MKGGVAVGKSKADILLEESFEQYSKAIEKFCYVRLGEASDYASDCLQETYCLFYRKLLDGTEFENPRAFLYKTANNMVLKAKENYYKNAKRTKSLDEAENIPTYIEESIEDNEQGYLANKISKLIGFFNLIFGELNEEEKNTESDSISTKFTIGNGIVSNIGFCN